MTNAAREDGSNVAHERLSQEVVAEEPGYFYIYLSNDSQTGSEAFFDDFTIQTSESYIVQQINYYPYGMVAREFRRLGDKATNDLFQGKTYEDLTKWYDFHARQYDAALGRWFGVDPQDQFASPYLAMGNNPVMMVDPDGEIAFLVAIGISAGISVISNGIRNSTNNRGFFQGAGKAALFGAASGALTMGVGSVFGAVGQGAATLGDVLSQELGRAFAHGVTQTMLGTAFTGQFSMSTFYSSSASSLMGSATHNLRGGAQIGASALTGGISSSIAGGDFISGFARGGIISGLNHLVHKQPNDPWETTGKYEKSGRLAGIHRIVKQKNGYTTYADKGGNQFTLDPNGNLLENNMFSYFPGGKNFHKTHMYDDLHKVQHSKFGQLGGILINRGAEVLFFFRGITWFINDPVIPEGYIYTSQPQKIHN